MKLETKDCCQAKTLSFRFGKKLIEKCTRSRKKTDEYTQLDSDSSSMTLCNHEASNESRITKDDVKVIETVVHEIKNEKIRSNNADKPKNDSEFAIEKTIVPQIAIREGELDSTIVHVTKDEDLKHPFLK